MKIKQFIVTYNNNEILNNCLESLSDVFNKYSKDEYKVFIINNHTNFQINEKFEKYVKVLHNQTRPDFSTGHLSRNWNQSIINGFVDLDNPDCDILITNQNDCEFDGDFIPRLIELHKTYNFIQFGAGDNFVSYTIDAVKNVGLWDERFCNIGFQEADYFLRQLLYNTNGCSINDIKHFRQHNPILNNIIKDTICGHDRGEESHFKSMKHHHISDNVYNLKWGDRPYNHAFNGWNYETLKHLSPKIHSFIYYPYFEKKIKSLYKQNYLI